MCRCVLSAGVGCVLALSAFSCAGRPPARMYDGPELPRDETARIVVQPDRDGVLMRIESVDGMRAPNVAREFHDRDEEVFVRAGHHDVTVRIWAARIGPSVVGKDGEPEELVRIATGESRILGVTAEGGHDYEIRTWRAPFDPDARQVTVPPASRPHGGMALRL